MQNLLKWGICDVETAISLATDAPRQAINLPKFAPNQAAHLLRWKWDEISKQLTWKRLTVLELLDLAA